MDKRSTEDCLGDQALARLSGQVLLAVGLLLASVVLATLQTACRSPAVQPAHPSAQMNFPRPAFLA